MKFEMTYCRLIYLDTLWVGAEDGDDTADDVDSTSKTEGEPV